MSAAAWLMKMPYLVDFSSRSRQSRLSCVQSPFCTKLCGACIFLSVVYFFFRVIRMPPAGAWREPSWCIAVLAKCGRLPPNRHLPDHGDHAINKLEKALQAFNSYNRNDPKVFIWQSEDHRHALQLPCSLVEHTSVDNAVRLL